MASDYHIGQYSYKGFRVLIFSALFRSCLKSNINSKPSLPLLLEVVHWCPTPEKI